MCKKCSRFYTKLPPDELCPDCPSYVSIMYPQRCCQECHERVIAHIRTRSEHPKPLTMTIVGERIIDSVDYSPSFHSKVYEVKIPYDRTVYPHQSLRVVLGGRVNHVIVPDGIHSGDTIYVRANDVLIDYPHEEGPRIVKLDTSRLVDEVVEEVVDRLHEMGELHSRQPSEDSGSSGYSRSVSVDSGYASRSETNTEGFSREKLSRNYDKVNAIQRSPQVTCSTCSHSNNAHRRHCKFCYHKL